MIGIPILQGRSFRPTDVDSALQVAIVSKTFAETIWPGENPLGKRIKRQPGSSVRYREETPWLTVVGVVPDFRPWGLANERWEEHGFYLPLLQRPKAFMIIFYRTQGAVHLAEQAIRREMARLDPDSAVYRVRTIEEDSRHSLFQHILMQQLLSVFGTSAFVLAVVGVFGVVAFSVQQRTREIGIRMALGADRARIIATVLRQASWQIGAGLIIGLGLSFAGTRFMDAFLFRTETVDRLVYVAVAFIIGVVSLAACLVPARQAARVHPNEALRTE